ncbi:MAG: tetratricopeptide repeat protein [Vicinamibacterales bacterium]
MSGTPASVDGSKATAASVPTAARAAARLADVALPDLSAVAAPVQTQIRARFDAVQRPSGNAPADERAGQCGELGHVLSAATFFDEAVLSYRHAEALQPTVATWPYLRGHASLRKGDREDAAAAFERALTLKPDYLPARVWLGDVQLDLGKPEAARATFDAALARQPDSAPALFGAGRAALERRAYADAVQHLEHALRIDPRASVMHYPLAMAFRGLGQNDKADEWLRKRGSVAPQLQDPMLQSASVVLDSAVSYESIGMQALRQQDWTGAVQAFRRGLEVAPDDPSLRYWMASAMIAGGDATGAIGEFEAIVRAHPDYAKAHFSLGAVYDQQGKAADALREYQAAAQFAPNLPDAHLRLALALRRSGKADQAVKEFETTVSLDPAMADAWVGGTQTLLALGRKEQAREWITRGKRLHPNRPEWTALEPQAR